MREYHHEIYVLFRERILFARLKILCPQNFLRPLSNVLGRAHDDQMRIVLSQQQACFCKWPLLKSYATETVTKILGLFALDSGFREKKKFFTRIIFKCFKDLCLSCVQYVCLRKTPQKGLLKARLVK